MSAEVDEHAPQTHEQTHEPSTDSHPQGHHPVADRLIDPAEDRWRWRRRIRSNPHQLRVYRVVIGLIGLVLILLGLATGWLPGPGGIPLVLLGLAVWASEFRWAHRLMLRLKHALHVFRGWSRGKQALFWTGFILTCALLGWAYLAVLGPPAWIPVRVDRVLAFLPGVDIPS